MTMKTRKIPSYRLRKPTGQAVVRLDGHDYYLGKQSTEESYEAYRRKIAEWLTFGPVVLCTDPGQSDRGPALTVNWKDMNADGQPF